MTDLVAKPRYALKYTFGGDWTVLRMGAIANWISEDKMDLHNVAYFDSQEDAKTYGDAVFVVPGSKYKIVCVP